MESELLRRYFRGKTSPLETARIRAWLEADEPLPLEPGDGQSPEPLIRGERLWKMIAPHKHPSAVTRFDLKHAAAGAGSRLPARPVRRIRRTLALSAMAMCLTAGVSVFLISRSEPLTRWTEARRDHRAVSTENGQKAVLTLADGSVIRLNGGSRLEYPANFLRGDRTLRLRGEAFFEVAADAERPFVVLTENSRTRVLGTAFNVRAYPGEAVTLAVEHGLVSFGSSKPQNAARPEGADILLRADEAAVLHSTNHLARRLPGNASGLFAWKDGVLTFDNRTLAEIGIELERWFGVSVDIRSPEAAAQRFTGRYERADLRLVARDLSLALGVHHRHEARTLTFY